MNKMKKGLTNIEDEINRRQNEENQRDVKMIKRLLGESLDRNL